MHETQKVRIFAEHHGRLATVVRIFGNGNYVDVVFCDDHEPATLKREFVVPAEDAFKQFWGIWHLTDYRDGKVFALCGPEITQKGPMLPGLPTTDSVACGFCQMLARGELIPEESQEATCPICQTDLIAVLCLEYDMPMAGPHPVRCRKCKTDLDVNVKQTFVVRTRINAPDDARQGGSAESVGQETGQTA